MSASGFSFSSDRWTTDRFNNADRAALPTERCRIWANRARLPGSAAAPSGAGMRPRARVVAPPTPPGSSAGTTSTAGDVLGGTDRAGEAALSVATFASTRRDYEPTGHLG